MDWAFASSIPESMLLATPGLPQYRDETNPEELRVPFKDGFIAAIPEEFTEERTTHKYRKLLERDQIFWRLSRPLNFDSIDDYSLFSTVWHSVHGPEKDLGQYFLEQRHSPNYTRLYEELQKEDQPFSKIDKDEKDYFRNRDFKKTIAKKLTLVSEWEGTVHFQ
ncbi:uncharacterized protein TRUGW13939_09998 [Talaromyces rugulosus]|uniref:Uncharacterized protein n=1 Tax=Talaromyces rugulosus TaxID=121627 RepID=A0A7H8RE70_TALRU|nr:uncharacterized protein TRUGW13939_09998 [Talaromyces rugulosus]QKX62833.1 hypothetical protein TRUGW13939_09998 [Talaromyces rugulosus]